jgi:hypothetical protein
MLEAVNSSYSSFLYAMRSPMTREKYVGRLAKLFDFLEIKGSMEERCMTFVERAQKEQDWAFQSIVKFVHFQRSRVDKKEITAATLHNYIKATKLFCEMNDIAISWKKITRGLPRGRRYANDRAPTFDEIRRILDYPDRRIKPIVLTMLSSGIRLGAWDYLRWGDVKPIEKDSRLVAARLRVYAGEEDEYFTFISEEAYRSLKDFSTFGKFT